MDPLLGTRLVVVLFGSVFIAIGNLLPRTRPNLALGIRTSRTLSDRAFWIRLHRTCGYLSVALGVVIVVAGVLIQRPGDRPGRWRGRTRLCRGSARDVSEAPPCVARRLGAGSAR